GSPLLVAPRAFLQVDVLDELRQSVGHLAGPLPPQVGGGRRRRGRRAGGHEEGDAGRQGQGQSCRGLSTEGAAAHGCNYAPNRERGQLRGARPCAPRTAGYISRRGRRRAAVTFLTSGRQAWASSS